MGVRSGPRASARALDPSARDQPARVDLHLCGALRGVHTLGGTPGSALTAPLLRAWTGLGSREKAENGLKSEKGIACAKKM